MFKCPYCQTENADAHNFCISCDRQIKCPHCGTVLVPEKAICLCCGVRVGTGVHGVLPVNEILLDQKTTGRSSHSHLEARFSDVVAATVGPMIAPLAAARVPLAPAPRRQADDRQLLLPLQGDGGPAVVDADHLSAGPDHDAPVAAATQPSGLPSWLRSAGDDVEVDAVDFLGRNKKEQQQRLVLLYCWGCQRTLSEPGRSREQVVNAARRVGIHDARFGEYLDGLCGRDLRRDGDGALFLTALGERQVSEILAAMQDDNAKGFDYRQKPSTPGRKRGSLGDAEGRMLEEWVKRPVDLNGFDVRSLATRADRALFAVWVLTIHLKVAPGIKPRMAHAYALRKFQTIAGDGDAFGHALRGRNDLFERNSEGKYYLTQEGERRIAGLVQGTGAPTPPAGSEGANTP